MQEGVFNEWSVYAGKKVLKERAIALERIKESSKLKIVAISGVRRSGKTSILILLYNLLKKQKEKVSYINLEDGRIKNNPNVLDEILKWFGDTGYLILDEITSVDGWESWLARNHELLKGRLNIVVSSSRSSLATPVKALRGRMITYEIYTLSFKEFLEFKDIKYENTTAGIGIMERQLQEYLIYGGFPESVLIKDYTEKINLINTYFKDIIGLDVAEISGENVSTVELFGKYILDAPYFSASKCLNFFKSLGHKIAKQTLLNLESFSYGSYLFFFVSIFSRKIKDRLLYPRKAYLGDSSFMYAITGRTDMGRLFENAVFLELKRKVPRNRDINYWKNKNEIEADFIIREGLDVKEIIQVVYEIKDEKTRKREINGLVAGAKELGLKRGLIITKDYEGKENVGGVNIYFIPLWKWLLSN